MQQPLAPIFVIPLYYGSDEGVTKYFKDHRPEIDAITGNLIVVHLATSVAEGEVKDIASATGSARYPGLKAADFPCLWIEKDGAHFVLRLSGNFDEVKNTFRALVDEVTNVATFPELEKKMTESKEPSPGLGPAKVPPWFPVAGYAAGMLTLVFFMGLVIVSLFMDKTVPQGGKWAATVALSLGIGLSTLFLGGSATVSGKLKIPFVKDNPVAFGIAGGAAVTLIFILIGYYTYVIG